MTQEFENEIVIIDDWSQDETYDGSYPEGAREKNSYFSPDVRNQEYIKPDWRYLFKLSRSWCPCQFWMEIIAFRFGHLIGVDVPPAWPAINNRYEKRKRRYGALIEWFYNEKSTGYYPGGQTMTVLIDNYDHEKGTKHNWISLYEWLDTVGEDIDDWASHWARIFTFDTLIGNTDRHQHNWGIIDYGECFRFSPAFDNGTALGYEIQEKKLKEFISDKHRINSYILKGRHHMKWSLDEKIESNYFDFMKKFVAQNPETVSIINNCLDFVREEVEAVIFPLCDLLENENKLSRERVIFVLELIMARKKLLEESLGI